MAGRRGTLVAIVLAAVVVAAAVVFFYPDPPGAVSAPESASSRTEAQAAPKPAVVQPHPLPVAVARVAGVERAPVQGSVRLISREAGGVAIDYRLDNLPPGPHVLAVHESGDCPPAEGASPDSEIGQVVANVMGRTRGKMVDEGLTLGLGGDADVMGRALVVHETDLTGRVLGCGAIGSP